MSGCKERGEEREEKTHRIKGAEEHEQGESLPCIHLQRVLESQTIETLSHSTLQQLSATIPSSTFC